VPGDLSPKTRRNSTGDTPAYCRTSRLPRRSNASPLASLLSLVDTLRISAETIALSVRGKLSEEIANERLEWWAHRVVAHAGARIRVQGLGNREEGRAYVIMSNHQSNFDVPVLFYALGPRMRMVGKKELFDVPLFGPAMRRAGFIAVDRKDHARAIASMERVRDSVLRGMSIYLAPEGTRSTTGELGKFKKGGFLVAQQTGTPILPITLRGTRDVLPSHSPFPTRDVDVDVVVHAPLDVTREEDPKHAREDLMERTRAAIASAL
jgi:1-acyl-sn-glycerol-3-phosphate acyltransferase